MYRNSVIAAAFLISACSPVGLLAVSNAQSAIKDMLNDPASAQWKDITVVGPCVRGQVNAKNGFGGYTPFAPFFYNTDTKEAGVDPGNSTDAELLLGLTERHEALLRYSDGFVKCTEAATAYVKQNGV